ncbi:MAG: Eco57I restriction-modification methylase domain-containing protein, partial [Bacteroidales bacterium]|nr:Eco57I restriction-modification methylase domain-containing protein [Bacteroidales bacterium]
TTDLDKIEPQAFGYKNNQPACTYVIISNFEKLRFYIDNAVDHLEFNLFTLDEEQFKLLYTCLAYENISTDLPKKLKEASLSEEDKITKELYQDYSLFKQSLFRNMVERNPEHKELELFKKSQKLLDRFLFIFFAEDRSLLPPNSMRKILRQWMQLKELDEDIPLYNRFRKYFGYMNTGFKGKKEEVFAYNGGLFKPDEVLDKITIDDDILYNHTLKLSQYDYASEVDVNILGHIFEHSLNEIEEIKAQIDGKPVNKNKTKRKKDGVYYTPKYITRYIVENTVGKLCVEKRRELGIVEAEYLTERKRNKSTKKPLLNKLETYREWLLRITICDPACGSGAFLNQALDYLIREHRYIDELKAKITGFGLVFEDVENSILENNLYGVDLNEESVEIAKLSLWLRTARQKRKLNSLNNNIKCGNSLIDNPAVAGNKAFNWENEFPHVFANGGFDVVIGNPPYVRLESMKDTSEEISKLNYLTYSRRGDLYCLFIEKGILLLKNGGYISYIIPNKWLQASYGKPLKQLILKYDIQEIIDFGDLQIFEDATTYPCIINIRKNKPNHKMFISSLNNMNLVDFDSQVINTRGIFNQTDFSKDTWIISSTESITLLNKLKSKFAVLADIVEGASRGIIPGLSEAFIINSDTTHELIEQDKNSQRIIAPILRGRDITRYGTPLEENLDYIILASFESHKYLKRDFFAIFNHLQKFENQLKKRGQCNGSLPNAEKNYPGQHHWLELDNNPTDDYLSLFQLPKIMYQVFQVKPNFIFDEQGLYCNNSMWIIPTNDKGLMAVLNSKLGWWLITQYCSKIQNGYQLIWKYFGQIPMVESTNELKVIADQMLLLHRELRQQSETFLHSLTRHFGIEKFSGKLGNWYQLTYTQFLTELRKMKINLSLNRESEWESFFLTEQQKLQTIQRQIDKTDRKVDQMVYHLYGLTEEEIAFIEKIH